MNSLIVNIADFFCGYPLFFLLIGGGAFLFVYSRALPLRYLREAYRSLSSDQSGAGQISSFQALMSTISSTVGLGNIAGVAIALVVGGPGSIFWMWVSALFGMATKFFEGVLAIKYKGTDDRGEIQGGPMYVIIHGLGRRFYPLAVLFAIAGCIGCLCPMQANQLCEAITTICVCPAFDVADTWVVRLSVGLTVGAIVAIVVLGGISRVAKVASHLVPTMVGFYFLMVLGIIIANIHLVPDVFRTIIHGAFSLEAGFGALVGVALTGARRAMYVNEAGVGTAGMMHGASANSSPVREGFVAMLGPAIDSGFVCTLTAIPIIMAGCYHVEGIEGLSIAFQAYDVLIPMVGKYLLMFVILIFAFSTLFSYSYYGIKCTNFLFGTSKGKYYAWFYIISIIASSVMSLGVAVSIIDLGLVMMCIPNMIAVLRLSPKVMQELREFENTRTKK